MHAEVGQIVLKCNVFKTIFVRPTETRVQYHDAAWRGQGRTWLAVLKHGGTLGPCFKAQLQLRRLCVQRGKWFRTEQDGAQPGARIQSGPSHAARRGAPRPPTIMAIPTALPRLLMATAAPAMTWLPLNVTIVDNDRGDSPSPYRARVLRAGAPELPPGTP